MLKNAKSKNIKPKCNNVLSNSYSWRQKASDNKSIGENCPVGSPHTGDRKGLSRDSNFIKLHDTIEIIIQWSIIKIIPIIKTYRNICCIHAS
jgi:hypothetical protein